MNEIISKYMGMILAIFLSIYLNYLYSYLEILQN